MNGADTRLARKAIERAGSGRLVVLIDGRSGSGKSTLARCLADDIRRLTSADPQLIRLDDVYPGWSGLKAASHIVSHQILSDQHLGYRRYDWESHGPGEWVPLSCDRALIIEGAGALTRQSHRLASVSIWLDADADTRYRRVRTRDGADVDRWWSMWAEQEDEHIARHHPQGLADIVIDTSSESPYESDDQPCATV